MDFSVSLCKLHRAFVCFVLGITAIFVYFVYFMHTFYAYSCAYYTNELLKNRTYIRVCIAFSALFNGYMYVWSCDLCIQGRLLKT